MNKSTLPLTAASLALLGLGSLSLSAPLFAATDLPQGYELAQADKAGEGAKGAEAKCGEGKCGEGAKGAEAKCGEGKCGEGKSGEGKKAGEAKCGEGKCGEDKKGG